jgi:hypothetical protein
MFYRLVLARDNAEAKRILSAEGVDINRVYVLECADDDSDMRVFVSGITRRVTCATWLYNKMTDADRVFIERGVRVTEALDGSLWIRDSIMNVRLT